MIADNDPVVAQALELLVPRLTGDVEELLSRARSDAARAIAGRRKRRLVIGIAFAALVLLAGAAIAASKFNLLPFLQTHDRDSARFSIDRSRIYRGGAPAILECPATTRVAFVCTPGATAGARVYALATRVTAQPELTRAGMLAQLAAAERNGVGQGLITRFRADVGAVSDQFIGSLNLIVGIETISGGPQVPGRPGLELAPPTGVPMWAVCTEQPRAGFGCRSLAGSVNVDAGTPIYQLRPGTGWHRVTRSRGQRFETGRLIEALLGRPANRAEIRLLLDVETVTSRSSPAGSSPPPVKHRG